MNSAIVGYVTRFGGEAKDFQFATIMGAGHEVPTFKPHVAHTMITRFQHGVPLDLAAADLNIVSV